MEVIKFYLRGSFGWMVSGSSSYLRDGRLVVINIFGFIK